MDEHQAAGIAYKGSRLDIGYTDIVAVTLVGYASGGTTANSIVLPAPSLVMVDGKSVHHLLKAGATVTLPSLQRSAIGEATQ